jgi:glycosyltransferase involved in cell wall biosynthesis
MRAAIQFCTYNRAKLLERVLECCFDQTLPPDAYEVVVVDDGSSDDTPVVLERAAQRATCALTVVRQANSGLAAGRNAGIARARGARIAFIDDDVLPLPNFLEEHLRSGDAKPAGIVRGGAIEVEDIDELPTPLWSIRNYSANYFWTTNVSVPLETIRKIGGFNTAFAEYGWEDIDVGLRLRAAGVKATFNSQALVFHVKPPIYGADRDRTLAQARAKARTAVALTRLHPGWRTALATGINPVQRGLASLRRRLRVARVLGRRLVQADAQCPLTRTQTAALRALAYEAYYEELERALRA